MINGEGLGSTRGVWEDIEENIVKQSLAILLHSDVSSTLEQNIHLLSKAFTQLNVELYRQYNSYDPNFRRFHVSFVQFTDQLWRADRNPIYFILSTWSKALGSCAFNSRDIQKYIDMVYDFV